MNLLYAIKAYYFGQIINNEINIFLQNEFVLDSIIFDIEHIICLRRPQLIWCRRKGQILCEY